MLYFKMQMRALDDLKPEEQKVITHLIELFNKENKLQREIQGFFDAIENGYYEKDGRFVVCRDEVSARTLTIMQRGNLDNIDNEIIAYLHLAKRLNLIDIPIVRNNYEKYT